MDAWYQLDETSGTDALVLPAEPDAQDALIVSRAAPLIATGTHSFLRAIKPDWRLIVTAHPEPLTPESTDSVADSLAAAEIVRLDLDGRVSRSRRELAFASIARALAVLGLAAGEREALHREAYRWPIEIGRWDAVAVRGLEEKFQALRNGLEALSEAARAGRADAWGGPEPARAALARWARARAIDPEPDRIGSARRLLARHENRIGVFAEADAILHYFHHRLGGGPPA